MSLEGLNPQWIRPRPPRLPVLDGEVRKLTYKKKHYLEEDIQNCICFIDFSYISFMQLVWLNPDNNHELLWDHGMCADTSRGAAVRDLIARALKGPLAPPQQEVLQPCDGP